MYQVALPFKNQLIQTVRKLNEDLSHCQILTPQVSFFQVARLQHTIQTIKKNAEQSWQFLSGCEPDLREAYFRELIENLENNPDVVFPDLSRDCFTEKPQRLAVFEMEELEWVRGGDGQHPSTTPSETMEEDHEPAVQSEEEKTVERFLANNKEIRARVELRAREMRDRLASKLRASVYNLINKAGSEARCVVLSEGELVLIRRDPRGNLIMSKGVSSQWMAMSVQQVEKGKISWFKSKGLNLMSLKSNLNDVGKNLGYHKIDVVSTSLNSITGTIGEMLYELAEGKKKVSDISKDFVVNSGSDIVMSMISGAVPMVALAFSSVVGAFSIHSLLTNRMLTKKKKAQILAAFMLKGGTKSAIAVCGAVLGNLVIPVPLVGSIVGSIIGGFAASATFSAMNYLLGTQVIFEPLAFYCLAYLHQKGVWSKEPLETYPHQLFEKFCRLLSFISPIEPLALEKMVDAQKKVYHHLLEEMYIAGAEDVNSQERVRHHKSRWTTLLAFAVLCYFHFMMSLTLTSQEGETQIYDKGKLVSSGEKIKIDQMTEADDPPAKPTEDDAQPRASVNLRGSTKQALLEEPNPRKETEMTELKTDPQSDDETSNSEDFVDEVTNAALEEVYLSAISKFPELLELEETTKYLAAEFAHDGYLALNRSIYALAEAMQNEKIKCLFFRPKGKKPASHSDTAPQDSTTTAEH